MKNNNYEVIANHVESGTAVKDYEKFHTINLNLLLFKGVNKLTDKKYDLIYWGSYRPNREKYFREYFDADMMLSTSQKNLKKFRDIGCKATGINKLSWDRHQETLNLFKYTLYIEDEKTHNHYSHLANRFYEALQCNVLTFFDSNTAKTTAQAGLSIPDFFFVEGSQDLKNKIKIADKDFLKLLSEQHKWVDQEIVKRKQMMQQLNEVFYA